MASSQAISSRKKNTANDPLADIQKMYVFVPPQNIKLGLMKNSIEAMSRNGEGFGIWYGNFQPCKHNRRDLRLSRR
jgi:hypothetical protein